MFFEVIFIIKRNKYTKKKTIIWLREKNWRIFLIFVGIIIVLATIDYYNFGNLAAHFNITFWAAIIGSVTTILGVYLTLNNDTKKRKKQNRLENRPYLLYTIQLYVYPYRIRQNRHKGVFDYILKENESDPDEVNNLLIPLDVRNLGVGLAIIYSIKVYYRQNGNYIIFTVNKKDKKRTKLIGKADNSIFYIEVKDICSKILETMGNVDVEEIIKKNVKIKIKFADIIGNRYRNTIKVLEFYDSKGAKRDLKEKLVGNDKYLKYDCDKIKKYLNNNNLIAKKIDVKKVKRVKK